MSRPNRNARRAQAAATVAPVADVTPAPVDIAAADKQADHAVVEPNLSSEASAASQEITVPHTSAEDGFDASNTSATAEIELVVDKAVIVQNDGVVLASSDGDSIFIPNLQIDYAQTPIENADAEATEPETDVIAAIDDLEAEPKRWLKMKVSMSGTEFSLSRGWKHAFCDKPGPDGEPSEAQRLVDAGFAVDTDAPKA